MTPEKQTKRLFLSLLILVSTATAGCHIAFEAPDKKNDKGNQGYEAKAVTTNRAYEFSADDSEVSHDGVKTQKIFIIMNDDTVTIQEFREMRFAPPPPNLSLYISKKDSS